MARLPHSEWSYAAAPGGIVNTTTGVTMKGRGANQLRGTSQLIWELTDKWLSVEKRIGRDGKVRRLPVKQEEEVGGSVNTDLVVQTLTDSGTGAVYVDAQGFLAP